MNREPRFILGISNLDGGSNPTNMLAISTNHPNYLKPSTTRRITHELRIETPGLMTTYEVRRSSKNHPPSQAIPQLIPPMAEPVFTLW